MSDVRALLKAKRQEARITHPLASYTSAGQLRCIACGTAVKHASAWEGHIGSKTHRTNAARLREERAREEERERESLKRKAMEVDGADGDDDGEDDDVPMVDAKRRRTESQEPQPQPPSAQAGSKRAALPADFFSDPSMAPALADDEDEEGEEGGAPAPAGGEGKDNVIDLEWQQFQQSVLNAPDYRETYERATVMAEPVLSTEVPQGFPAGEGDVVDGGAGAGEKEEVLDEEARRRQKEQEERELIMDRLLEEEQAQEEADARVSVLKTKLEALKKQREAAKAAKAAKKGGKSS